MFHAKLHKNSEIQKLHILLIKITDLIFFLEIFFHGNFLSWKVKLFHCFP